MSKSNNPKILDGNALSKQIKAKIKGEILQDFPQSEGKPALAVIIVGDDSASRIYVNHKKKDCEECGINSYEYALPAQTSNEALLELIEELNADNRINGIIVQQPLPASIDVLGINDAISPWKDVDAFRADSIGKLAVGDYSFLPCTPAGVMELIHSTGVSVSGSECVVVGRSNIVGKPMAMMLLNESATVTVCHSRTRDLAEVTGRADILVSAVGKAKLITADMVKEGAIVIDVGMNRDENGKLCGDVDYTAVSEKASWITPVPGGVGPMTRAMLMKNTLTAKTIQDKG